MFDVVAVNMKTLRVRIMTENEEKAEADAYMKIAVMRRGVEEEFGSVSV